MIEEREPDAQQVIMPFARRCLSEMAKASVHGASIADGY